MDEIREFELFIRGLPDDHTARHVAGILRQALLNLGMTAEVEVTEV